MGEFRVVCCAKLYPGMKHVKDKGHTFKGTRASFEVFSSAKVIEMSRIYW